MLTKLNEDFYIYSEENKYRLGVRIGDEMIEVPIKKQTKSCMVRREGKTYKLSEENL